MARKGRARSADKIYIFSAEFGVEFYRGQKGLRALGFALEAGAKCLAEMRLGIKQINVL